VPGGKVATKPAPISFRTRRIAGGIIMGTQAHTIQSRLSMWPPLDAPLHEVATLDPSHAQLRLQLQLALAREKMLQEQSQEFEHRFFNSVQMIVSLLATQGRTAPPEVAAQLTIAANRIVAFGHVHRRLHALDRGRTVQFDAFLHDLCADLSGVFSSGPLVPAIVAETVELELPTVLGGPLGFLVSELVTNSAKHGKGDIKVRLQSLSPSRHSLSVSDDGDGLPEGFEPASSTGLGMKIVRALVDRIGGELRWSRDVNGKGTRFEVTFSAEIEPAGAAIAKESPLPARASEHRRS
jgi:two-component system, sensor histidine kinase PdtaS